MDVPNLSWAQILPARAIRIVRIHKFSFKLDRHHLQQVGDREVDIPPALAIEELSPLHHHEMGREVDAPS